MSGRHLLQTWSRTSGSHPTKTSFRAAASARRLSSTVDSKHGGRQDASKLEQNGDQKSAANGDSSAPLKHSPPIALPPSRRLAIVTCMDSRINPFDQLGIKEGEAHIIRNAGGMAKDALRSLIISQRLLGTREIAIYHHTGCGMVTFTSPTLRELIKQSDPQNTTAAKHVDAIDFLEFEDLEESVRNDVTFLKESTLLMPDTKITGWVYDVDTRKSTCIV